MCIGCIVWDGRTDGMRESPTDTEVSPHAADSHRGELALVAPTNQHVCTPQTGRTAHPILHVVCLHANAGREKDGERSGFMWGGLLVRGWKS